MFSMAGERKSKAGIPFDLKEPHYLSSKGRLARIKIGNTTIVFDPRHNPIKRELRVADEQDKGL